MATTQLRSALSWIAVVAMLGGCGGASLPEDSSPPITNSETGAIVGREATVTAVETVVDNASVRIIVRGDLPDSCYGAIIGFEEPDADGVLIGEAKSALEPDCSNGARPQLFTEFVEFDSIPRGTYTVRIDSITTQFVVP